jgi:hypothetical protein
MFLFNIVFMQSRLTALVLYSLTKSGEYKLKIEMVDADANYRMANYDTFTIGAASRCAIHQFLRIILNSDS